MDGNLSGMTPTRLFYFQNTLYSVYALTDTTGQIVEGYQYDAYGRQTVFTAPGLVGVSSFAGLLNVSQGGSSLFANPFLFTGRRLDAETSLYYYRARVLDPTEGRFLSRDPVPGVNLYEYLRDNPLRYLDRAGKDNPGCDLPDWVKKGLNVGNCELRCCAEHDACYFRHGCTWASWGLNAVEIGGHFFGPWARSVPSPRRSTRARRATTPLCFASRAARPGSIRPRARGGSAPTGRPRERGTTTTRPFRRAVGRTASSRRRPCFPLSRLP